MQGEFLFLGIDLDLFLVVFLLLFLLVDEDLIGFMEVYDISVLMVMIFYFLIYLGIDGDFMVYFSVLDSSMYLLEIGIMLVEFFYVLERIDVLSLVILEFVVIVRFFQVFTRGDELGSFVEVMFGIEAMSESGLGEDISFLLTVVVLLVVVEFFSSSGIISEKKKKKKDKVFRLIQLVQLEMMGYFYNY